MEDVTCLIMDNLLGKDFMNIERIYDLKGSTKGRRVALSQEEASGQQMTGLQVLKDLNFLDFEDSLQVKEMKKSKLN